MSLIYIPIFSVVNKERH